MSETVLTGNVLLVKGPDAVVAWLLTEDGVVGGIFGDRRADRNGSSWEISSQDINPRDASSQSESASFWMRLLQREHDKRGGDRDLEFSVGDGFAAVGDHKAPDTRVYHPGTEEILNRMRRFYVLDAPGTTSITRRTEMIAIPITAIYASSTNPSNSIGKFLAVVNSIDRSTENRAPNHCLPFDGIGAWHPGIVASSGHTFTVTDHNTRGVGEGSRGEAPVMVICPLEIRWERRGLVRGYNHVAQKPIRPRCNQVLIGILPSRPLVIDLSAT